jgi:hypothetical protein
VRSPADASWSLEELRFDGVHPENTLRVFDELEFEHPRAAFIGAAATG